MPIKVIPDKMVDLNELESRLISQDPTLATFIALNENSLKNTESFEEIQIIVGLLNEQSLADQLGLNNLSHNTDIKLPQIYGPLSNYTGVEKVIYSLYVNKMK